VNWAFNRAKLCIEIKGGDFTFHLLDSFLKMMIKLINKANKIYKRGHNDNNDKNFLITFGNLDRKVFFSSACLTLVVAQPIRLAANWL